MIVRFYPAQLDNRCQARVEAPAAHTAGRLQQVLGFRFSQVGVPRRIRGACFARLDTETA
jgi:hypothetical protein